MKIVIQESWISYKNKCVRLGHNSLIQFPLWLHQAVPTTNWWRLNRFGLGSQMVQCGLLLLERTVPEDRPPLVMVLKDKSEGKGPQWVELKAVHLVMDFLLREKWSKIPIHIDSCSMMNGSANWPMAKKEQGLRVLGKSYVNGLMGVDTQHADLWLTLMCRREQSLRTLKNTHVNVTFSPCPS